MKRARRYPEPGDQVLVREVEVAMELKLTRIGVGFDFSIGGRAALAAALELARQVGAGVTVITAVPGALDKRVVDRLKEQATKGEKLEMEATFLERVEQLVRRELQDRFDTRGVEVAYDVGDQPASKMLLASGKAADADLLVLGAVGNQPPKAERTVGTDVERVIRSSLLPVLVVRPGKPFPPQRILCAVDFSEAAERAVGWAFDFARLFGATVDLLHVLERDASRLNEMFGRVYPSGYADAERTLARQAMETFVAGVHSGGVKYDVRYVEGLPHETIADELTAGGYDLLSIGTLGRSAIVELLVGGTAERVIRASTTSVLAVKPDSFALKRGPDDRATGVLGDTGLVI
jgi:nucleotide-binding universal stress UspA family protein